MGMFWLFVMILKMCEQFFEGLPQTVINVVYLKKALNQDLVNNLSDWEIFKLVS